MFHLPYEEKIYAIVIVRPNGERHLFGRVRRSWSGDVFVIWTDDESPHNPGRAGDPHALYHASGRLHAKMGRAIAFLKNLQILSREFRGNQTIVCTNAERALSPSLPISKDQFDDDFEIPVDLVNGNPNQLIAVDLVEPGISPAEVTGRDRIVAEKSFQDDAPWIIVRLIEPLPDAARWGKPPRVSGV